MAVHNTGNTTISGTPTGLTGERSGTIQFSGPRHRRSSIAAARRSAAPLTSLSTYVSGTLPVANGGTGLNPARGGTAGIAALQQWHIVLKQRSRARAAAFDLWRQSGAPTLVNPATAAGAGSYINNGTTNQAAVANFNITSAATSSVTAAIRRLPVNRLTLWQFQTAPHRCQRRRQ